MAFDLITVPCLSDNYAFLLRDHDSGKVAVIDVPEAAPILAALKDRGWEPSQIWLTHHHDDHVQGLEEVLESYDANVIGGKADAHRLPGLDRMVEEGDSINLGALEAHVVEVPGHTAGHIAFYVPGASAAFTADSLMALGCGRLFEGTPAQMWDSMQKMMKWPGETTICSGHEYTASNAKFALTVDPDNPDLISRVEEVEAARKAGQSTVPSQLSTEMKTNPFLRVADPDIRAHLGMQTSTDTEVFAEIRKRKDKF
ncbi:MAG: hydroxyacylglutathione hydrolase [Sulfitobacter sp.]